MHVNDNVPLQRNMVLVPPIHYSAFYFPRSSRVGQPKVHPLAFMGDTYRRRVTQRVHCLFNICKWLMIGSLVLLAYSASAQGEVFAVGKAAEHTTDLLIKKDIVWISLFVACSAIGGMIVLGKFMKEMHLEFMKQTIEGTKALGVLAAEVSAVKTILLQLQEKHHR